MRVYSRVRWFFKTKNKTIFSRNRSTDPRKARLIGLLGTVTLACIDIYILNAHVDWHMVIIYVLTCVNYVCMRPAHLLPPRKWITMMRIHIMVMFTEIIHMLIYDCDYHLNFLSFRRTVWHYNKTIRHARFPSRVWTFLLNTRKTNQGHLSYWLKSRENIQIIQCIFFLYSIFYRFSYLTTAPYRTP